MPITVKKIVNDALNMCGIASDDDTDIDGNLGARTVSQLNYCLATLNAEGAFNYNVANYTYTVNTQAREITIGIGENIEIDVPQTIERIGYSSGSGSSFSLIPMVSFSDVVAREQADGVVGKPCMFGYSYDGDIATIIFDCDLQSGAQINISYVKDIGSITIADTLDIPNDLIPLVVYAVARNMAVIKSMPAGKIANFDTLYTQTLNSVKKRNNKNNSALLSGVNAYKRNIITG